MPDSARSMLPIDPPVIYSPVGHCIYCNDIGSSSLSDEHIIPYALNGTQVLPKSSCPNCGKVTSYLDGFAARSVFYQVRATSGARTRTQLPDQFPVYLKYKDDREERVMVPSNIHPSVLLLPQFAEPDLLSGRTPDGNFHIKTKMWQRSSIAFDEFVKEKGAESGEVEVWLKPQQFARVIAKIAHSYAVAQLGINGFHPFLIDLIHGRNIVKAPELIGSEVKIPLPATNILHQLDLMQHKEFVVVRIRLFASTSIDGAHGMPVYLAIAGKPIRK